MYSRGDELGKAPCAWPLGNGRGGTYIDIDRWIDSYR